MYNNILDTLVQVYNALTLKIKLAILGLILLIVITSAWFLVRTRTNVISNTPINTALPESINDARELIQSIGNPWQIDSNSYISNYPFLINEKIGPNLFILDVNTDMLTKPYYENLFKADIQLKESLEQKPLNYTDSYQVIYDSAGDRSISPYSRKLNFNKIFLDGEEKWFFEEDEEYWTSDKNTETTNLKRVIRNKELLPAFRKLTRIGPAKFIQTIQDTGDIDMVYIVFNINDDFNAYPKSGRVSFTFLEEPDAPIDPNFIGAFTTANVLPDTYPLSDTKVLQKSINAQQAVITFTDVSDVENPTIVENKTFNIKEYNSIFITCQAYPLQKCWIYNPGLKSITEIDGALNKKDIRATLDVDLTKLPASLDLTRDKDRLLRYNNESNELLFFYENKWQSIYRL